MLNTYSAFTYGHEVTIDNQTMPFSEDDVIELIAEFNTGAYTLESYANEMARAMNAAGTLNYISSVNRTTRKITISGDANFYLYVTSSSLSNVSPYSLLGFSTERSGADNYEGDLQSGSYFEPQLYLQKYIDFEDFQDANEVTVSESASGKVQVVKYGDVNFAELNITLQTNIEQGKGSEIKNDTSGEDNLRAFMKYIVKKAPIEFIKDLDNPDIFTDCLLEKSQFSQKGTGYKIRELYSKGLAKWFESGLLTFREIK